MRSFFGGQINPEHRGNLALVIEAPEDSLGPPYSRFLYGMDSDEFIHLTGVRLARKMPERVYIGISQQAGETALRLPVQVQDDLRRLDNLLVISHFLNIVDGRPERIVLEKTSTGYRVAEYKEG